VLILPSTLAPMIARRYNDKITRRMTWKSTFDCQQGRRFCLLRCFENGPGSYPTCPQVGIEGFLFGKQRNKGVRKTSNHYLVQGNSILPSSLSRYGTTLN
jgi:hypothetical protein